MTDICNILCKSDSDVSGGTVNNPPEFVMYRRDELALVDGDHCAAFVLNLLRGWQGDQEWVEATQADISTALSGMFSRNRIIAALKLLREKGLVQARENPHNRQIRTLQYHVVAGGAE